MPAVTVALPLLEAMHSQPPAAPTGLRFFPDGRMEVYSTFEVVPGDGKPTMRTVPLGWHFAKQLPPEKLAEIEALIRSSGYLALPDTIDADGRVMDGGTWTWVAHVDGEDHKVVLRGTPYAKSPVIDKLFVEIQAIPYRP